MNHGKRRKIYRGKDGIVRYKVLMVWWAQEIRKPVSHSFTRKLKLWFGKWKVKKVSCDVCKRLFTVGEDDFGTRRMVGLQHFSKTSRNQKRASITQSWYMFLEQRIQGRICLRAVLGINRLLLFIWTRSYHFGLLNFSGICLCFWQKKK